MYTVDYNSAIKQIMNTCNIMVDSHRHLDKLETLDTKEHKLSELYDVQEQGHSW